MHVSQFQRPYKSLDALDKGVRWIVFSSLKMVTNKMREKGPRPHISLCLTDNFPHEVSLIAVLTQQTYRLTHSESYGNLSLPIL